jgi:hypothetical protein
MAKSLDEGLFWTCLAVRHSCMFDEIYWAFLDEKYFGPFTTMEQRISLLTEKEQGKLDEFVQTRLQQAKEERLDIYQDVDNMVDL